MMCTLYLERTTRYCPLEQLRRQRYADDVKGALLWVQSSTKAPHVPWSCGVSIDSFSYI